MIDALTRLWRCYEVSRQRLPLGNTEAALEEQANAATNYATASRWREAGSDAGDRLACLAQLLAAERSARARQLTGIEPLTDPMLRVAQYDRRVVSVKRGFSGLAWLASALCSAWLMYAAQPLGWWGFGFLMWLTIAAAFNAGQRLPEET